MSQNTSITCDACGKELIVDSPNPHNYCLHLSVADHGRNTSGGTYALMQHPPIKSAKDFCGLTCLQKWINTPESRL